MWMKNSLLPVFNCMENIDDLIKLSICQKNCNTLTDIMDWIIDRNGKFYFRNKYLEKLNV